MTLNEADLIWNRACMPGAPPVQPGERHLSALLLVHNMVMNGGVGHAVLRRTVSEMIWGVGAAVAGALEAVSLDAAELDVAWRLQRIRRQLLHRETKTEASDATLPLPDICVTALRLRDKHQGESREAVGDDWTETGLVFTTRYGTLIDPRNFKPELRRAVP